jgi:acetyl esterase/lipase
MNKIFALVAALAGLLTGTVYAGLQTDVEYGQADGESLKLDLSVPDGPGPFPAIILVHGGSWVRGDKSAGPKNDSMAPMFDALTRGGFAWFAINYRLAPAYRYPADLEDVTTAIHWVKKHAAQYHIDPDRIAICGHSSGGHLAALAAVTAKRSDRVSAVVCFSTPFDIVGTPKPGAPMHPALAPLFGMTNLTAKAIALETQASPIYHVKAGLPPFLIVQGTADKSVNYSQATNMLNRLTEVHVPCQVIAIPGGQHGMETWDAFTPDYRDQVVKWLQATLNKNGQ